MRWIGLLLGTLIVLVQASLWLGKGSLPYAWSLQRQLDAQLAANTAARERNVQLESEVNDFREGLEMVEDKARNELGMLKPDEILVQVTRRR